MGDSERALTEMEPVAGERGVGEGKIVGEGKAARPFLKWAGGKGQLVPELMRRLPPSFSTYYEPFLGGGALFFALRPAHAVLLDVNQDLVNVYAVVKRKLPQLVESLSRHVYEESYFYSVRQADRSPDYPNWSDVERASRFIFLNKTCFNGLYRVNSKGLFNVPFGDYTDPTICDTENLTACSHLLSGTTVQCGDFRAVENDAVAGDFVYFDPPYAPLNATSSFVGYAKGGFTTEDQTALRDLCDRLAARGVQWMVSNSSAPLVLELYKHYKIERVSATRAINSKGTKRGKIEEIIVRNYG
jgi:DNA adenine methylase